MKPLTVHMIIDAPLGAYHHYCAQLCNALVGRDEIREVRLISFFEDRAHPGIDPAELELLDARVRLEVIGPAVPTKIRRYLLFFANFMRYVWRLLKAPPDVAHIQTPVGLQLIDLLLIGLYRALGVRTVRTVHEATAGERTRLPTTSEEALGNCQLRLAHVLITHDATTRHRLLSTLGVDPGRVVVVPHGNYLIFRKYMPGNVEDEERRSAPFSALFFGIKRHKGIEVFIDALRRLKAAGRPIKAVVVGRVNPGDEDVIHALRQVGTAELAPGYIPNDELWRIYLRSDLVVMPYLKGTTSGAVHLAYAFKRPVIASDLECFRNIVIDGKTGLVVPKGDPEALARAILQMQEQPAKCRLMGEEGFRLVSSAAYDWHGIAARTVEAYRPVSDRR